MGCLKEYQSAAEGSEEGDEESRQTRKGQQGIQPWTQLRRLPGSSKPLDGSSSSSSVGLACILDASTCAQRVGFVSFLVTISDVLVGNGTVNLDVQDTAKLKAAKRC